MKKIIVIVMGSLTLAGCFKIEHTSKKITPPPTQVTIPQPTNGDTIIRYYTFISDTPYKIDFSISPKEIIDAENLLKAIDKEGLENAEGRLFAINKNDRNFLPQYWQCIYHSMYRINQPVIARLAQVFQRIKHEQNLNHIQLAYTITRFVQYMQYCLPPGIGIYSPARTLAEYGKGKEGTPSPEAVSGWHGAGDCDTKSLLLVLLLLECGYDAVVLDSYRYHHAMAAVHLPGIDGVAIDYRGKQYYVIESTYPGWNIGQMPPHYSELSYFIPIDPREGRVAIEQAMAQSLSNEIPLTQGPSEREPNNTLDTADKVSNILIQGKLDENDSEDWYRLTGQEGTFAAITLIPEGDCSFNLEVFSDDSKVATATATSNATTVTASIPGICHLRVHRISGQGKYTIIITQGGTAEKEPNDNTDDATQSSDIAIVGELTSQQDIDWYFLGGQEGFNSTYTIYHPKNTNFDFEVYNDGKQIGTCSDENSGSSITLENPGRVHLKVFSKRGKGWYLIKIDRNR